MSMHLLGKQFDIHGGGQDLQFPHHENEIAQSEGAHGGVFVNYWMHNGFVRVDNEKMSKSLGNFSTIRDVLQKFDAEVLRFFILRAHYRSPLNYSDFHLRDAKESLDTLYFALRDVPPAPANTGENTENTDNIDWETSWAARFKAAMDDDFDTTNAIAVLFQMAGEAKRSQDAGLSAQLRCLANLLGLLEREPLAYLRAVPATTATRLTDADIEEKIAVRAAAKKARDFTTADRVRDELKTVGVLLEDTPQGTVWRLCGDVFP
jgi:cysteinyl-tRNA synthetase